MKDFTKLQGIVKKALADESSGHDYSHTMRVYRNALEIAKHENVDIEIIKAATLFHDYAYSTKFFKGEHGSVSAKLAKPILKKAGFTPAQMKKILSAIEVHNFWIHRGKKFPIETKILRDADRLDAIGHIGVFRAIAYAVRANRDPMTILKEQLTSKFETKRGIALSKPRFRVMREFIAKLEADMRR